MMQKNNSGLRQAELIMTLSLATDMGIGRPMEWALCSALLGVRLGEALGLSDQELREVYYLALLRYIGCTTFMDNSVELFGDEPALAGKATDFVNYAKPREAFGFMFRYVAPERPPIQRLQMMARMPSIMQENTVAHCEVARIFVERFGLEDSIRDALLHFYESWDGSGMPDGLKGEAIALPMRVVQVVQIAESYRRVGSVGAAVAAIRERAGHGLDPRICTRFCEIADQVFGRLDDEVTWEAVLAAEPGSRPYLSEESLDNAMQVLADFIDMLAPYFAGHSRAVAALVGNAALHYGLAELDAIHLRRSGWLHDLGKINVPPGVWYKSRPLTGSEWERVRLHPYYTERILSHANGLTQFGVCAALHHERLDGSGYYRGIPASLMPPTARLLAAANRYQALSEPRAFRDALAPESVADTLRREVHQGYLDSDAVKAVLTAAGHQVPPIRRERLAGLSEREIEVLRLLARGLSKRRLAEQLGVSENTVGTHIAHIYDKINVSTRAGATLFAMQHNLLTYQVEKIT